MAFPIYTSLIVKTDPSNLSQVQATLRKSFSNNQISLDIDTKGTAQNLEKALRSVRRESLGLIGDLQGVGKQVDNVFRRFSAYLIASGGILGSIALFKTAVGEALKFQNELVKIKQVSGDADSEIKKLGDSVGNLAKQYGVSSSELVKSATILKQAGLTTKETTIAIQALAKTDLAPNFDSIAKTTEGLIAIFQQFGKNINNIEGQLGSLNAVAGEFAVEASDLITLVQKAGGAAASSGTKFNELLALFTSVRATTRESADAISTGLRTIFGRLQRPDTIKFLDDLGIKMRYTAEEAEKLGNVDLAGKFVGPLEAVLRISKSTANLGTGSTLFSNIVEEIGGLRQLSRVIPLLRETTLLTQALNVAQAGEGSLDIQALQKQDSYLNKLSKIKEEFLAIGRTLVESEGFNRFIKFLESAATGATILLNTIGPLLPYLGLIVGSNIIGGAASGFVRNTYRGFGGNVNEPPPIKRATGGFVPGPSMGDKVPALLEGGEAVIPASSVRQNRGLVSSLISGNLKGFAGGFLPNISGGNPEEQKKILQAFAEYAKKAGIDPKAFATQSIDILSKESLKNATGVNAGGGYAGLFQKILLSKGNKNEQILPHEMAHGLDKYLGRVSKNIKGDLKDELLKNDPKYQSLLSSGASKAILARFEKPNEIFARSIGETIRSGGDIRPLLERMGVSAEKIASINTGGRLLPNTRVDIPAPVNNLPLAGKLSTNNLVGNLSDISRNDPTLGGLLKTNVNENKASRYYNSLAIRSLDNDSANSQLQSILGAKEKERVLKNEIDSLKQGRREGREYYPKRLRGDTSGYDFSAVGSNAQAYLRDKGGYIGNIRAKEAELAQLRTNLSNPNFGIRSGSLTGPIGLGATGISGINNSNFGGWTSFSGNNPNLPNVPWQNINQGFVPFTGGGRGGTPLPPGAGMGAFGYGRGGVGGTGGGVGGTGGGGTLGANNSGLQSPQSIIKGFQNNRWLNGIASTVGFGAPLAFGYAASQSKNPATQTTLGSIGIGATLGASAGSLFGPIGTSIGAVMGGLYGWWKGAEVAAKELEKTSLKTKLDESIKGLNDTIENIANGSGSIGDLADSLDKVRKTSLAEAISKTKDGGDFVKTSSDEFKKSAGLQLPSIRKALDEEVKKQAKNGQPLDLKNEDTSRIIKTISSIRGVGTGTIEQEAKKIYESARTDQIRKEAEGRFQVEVNRSVASATAFADAVGRAAQETKLLDEKLKLITSGGYIGASFNVGEFGNTDKGALKRLSGLSNGALGQLTGTVNNVDEISKFLPDVLSRTVRPGQQSSDNISGDFEAAFKKIGDESGIQFDKKVIRVLGDKLQSLKGEELFEDFKKAPEKFAKDLISSYEPALKALQNIGKDLEERDKAYQDGLRHLLELNNRSNTLFSQKNVLTTSLLTLQKDFAAQRSGIDPSRVSDSSIIFGQFNKEQDRLLGKSGIGGNADAISQLISSLKEEEKVLRDKAKAEADGVKGITIFRDALFDTEKKIVNANKALENLANISERLASLQKDSAIIQKSKDAKLGLTKELVTATPQELIQKNYDAQAAAIIKNNGIGKTKDFFDRVGIATGRGPGFGSAVVKQGIGFLESVGANKIAGTNLTGEELAKKLLEDYNKKAKGNINVNKENAQLDAIQKQKEELLKQAGADGGALGGIKGAGGAIGVMLSNLANDSRDFKDTLTKNNTEFFAKLDKYIEALQGNAIKADIAVKNIRLSELEPQEKSINGLPKDLDLDEAKRQINLIKSTTRTKTDLDTATKGVSNRDDIDKLAVELSKEHMSSEDILTKLDEAGLSPDQREAVYKTLNKRKLNPEEQKRKELLEYTYDKTALESDKEYQKLLIGGTGVLKPGEVSKSIYESATGDLSKKFVSQRNKLTDPRFANLNEEQIKLIEGGKINSIRLEVLRLREEIAILKSGRPVPILQPPLDFAGGQAKIPGLGAAAGFGGQVPLELPRGIIGAPPNPGGKPPPQVSALGTGIGSVQEGLVSSFERANQVFTQFNNNFSKQVEALAAIPRIIDMNINQRVEVIINGADILNSLEPNMREIANGAVARAVEVIGGQLGENNIRISYNPNSNSKNDTQRT